MVDFSSLFNGRGISSAPFVFTEFDPDAQTYIDAVEVADGQTLEVQVANAITRFVKGCKDDGIWTAIKACCILAGARTLTGALVPLVGAAPTNINFASGDYNRKTGLKGNGTTKYLNTNRDNTSEPQNSRHLSVWINENGDPGNPQNYIGASATGSTFFRNSPGNTEITARVTSASNGVTTTGRNALGFLGVSRNNSANYIVRGNSGNETITAASVAPSSRLHSVFARNNITPDQYTIARMSFYSIGESLDLALLNTRVSALMTAFNRYIP